MFEKSIPIQLMERVKDNAEIIIRDEEIGYLSGSFVEILFLKKYEKLFKGRKFSTDWWCYAHKKCKDGYGKDAYGDARFVVFKDFEELNRVDVNLLRKLRDDTGGKKYDCSLAMIDSGKFCVYHLDISEDGGKPVIKPHYQVEFSDDKIKSFDDKVIRSWLARDIRLGKVDQTEKDLNRQVIEFLKEEGLFEKKALKIIKLHCFKKYQGFRDGDPIANIDVVGESDNKTPIYYEVKFKASNQWEGICVQRFEVETIARVFNEKNMFAKNVMLCNDLDNYKDSKIDEIKKWNLVFNLWERKRKNIGLLKWKILDFGKDDGAPKRLDKNRGKYFGETEKYTHFFYPIEKYEDFSQ